MQLRHWKNTMDSITNICLDCGFESQRLLTACLKERYKITPREYRKKDNYVKRCNTAGIGAVMTIIVMNGIRN